MYTTILNVSVLTLGLIGLWLGTKRVIDNATLIARHYKLSDLFVGIAILSVGTDLPELMVALNAGIKNLISHDTSDIVIGNSIGSCYGQIGLTLGVVALLSHLSVARNHALLHGGVAVGSVVALWLAGLGGQVERMDGWLLMVGFAAYMYILFRHEGVVEKVKVVDDHGLFKTWILLSVGFVVVIVSSELTVSAVIGLARAWDVSQSFIAIVVLGMGTSLPEFSLSIMALKKKQHGMSIGNLLGSNIFDALVPVGAAAILYPLQMDHGLLRFDIPLLLLLTLVVLVFLVGRRGMRRPEAVVLIGLYTAYIIFKIGSQ